MKPISLYQPQLSVVVYKTVGRTMLAGSTPLSERYTAIGAPVSSGGLGGVIDLSPWLDETGGVITVKGTAEPAGGFTVTLVDRPLMAVSLDTVYAAIEPMDYVEISMSYGDGQLPVTVMRGFISDVSRVEGMSDDGVPQRNVILSGQDFGKIWQIVQTFPLYARLTQAQTALTGYYVFEQWGLGAPSVLSANAFVTTGVVKGVNAALAQIMPPNLAAPKAVLTDTVEGGGYNVSVQSITTASAANIFQLLSRFGDVGVWNELFMDDRPDGVYCVYRPYPALPVGATPESQAFIRPVANSIDVTTITDEDVKSIRVSRSDGNVANFYWVSAPPYDLTIAPQVAVYIDPSKGPYMLQRNYQNSSATLYGDRSMEAEAMTFPSTVTDGSSGMTAQQISQAVPDWTTYVSSLQQALALTNRDNVIFEQGSIVVKGNPAIRAGTFLKITRGSITSSYYVRRVQHNFVPQRSYTTTLTVERGTGFIDRVTLGAAQGSPYSAEKVSS